MSAMNRMERMLAQNGAKYTKGKRSTDKRPVLRIVPYGGENYFVDVVFTENGDYFYTAEIAFEDELMPLGGIAANGTNDTDYKSIVNMVKSAPTKRGEHQEARSSDGQWIALVYRDNDAEYGVAFVCQATSGRFFAVVGF